MRVDYLPQQVIDHRAEETRLAAIDAGVSAQFPFDVESTVEFLFEYDLHLGANLPEGMLGSTSSTGKTVYISERINHDGRRRFTVAHEIGHIILHLPLLASQAAQPALFDVVEGPAQDERMEWQADYFAAALLMPRQMILTCYGDMARQGLWIDPQTVARDFGVSNQAAKIRLQEFSMILRQTVGSPLSL